MNFRGILFGAVGATLLFAAAPASAAMLSDSAAVDGYGVASSSLVQKISHTTPAGARCVKWTRRWNTRHGVGHRRCVQWR
jgi:hypothetical protein